MTRTAEERRARAKQRRAAVMASRRTGEAAELPERWDAWPPKWRESLEERAGIMEFDGGLARQVAEREAEATVRAEFVRRPAGAQ